MTVQNTIVKNVYVGNGSTTVFPFTFECNKAEHIQAFVKDAAGNITSTTNFKVDLEQKNVTYPNTGEPLPDGYKLIILRQLPLQQLLNLLNQGPFYAEDIEETFDEVVMMLQQMTERIGRSLAVSIDIDTENSFNTIIPLEAGKTFRVKDDGTGFEVTEDPGKVIDGAKALLKQTMEQAELAKEQAAASSQSAVSAQNAANAAEAVAPEYAKTKEVLDNIVSYTKTATEQASISAQKADAANVSATNAAQSYANANSIATQLTEYLATKESLTAPAVDKTLLIEGAAADANVVGKLKGDLADLQSSVGYANLFTENTAIVDKKTIQGGYIIDYESYSIISDYIPVIGGKTLYIYSLGVAEKFHKISAFTEQDSESYISLSAKSNVSSYEIPVGAKYIRFSVLGNKETIKTCMYYVTYFDNGDYKEYNNGKTYAVSDNLARSKIKALELRQEADEAEKWKEFDLNRAIINMKKFVNSTGLIGSDAGSVSYRFVDVSNTNLIKIENLYLEGARSIVGISENGDVSVVATDKGTSLISLEIEVADYKFVSFTASSTVEPHLYKFLESIVEEPTNRLRPNSELNLFDYDEVSLIGKISNISEQNTKVFKDLIHLYQDNGFSFVLQGESASDTVFPDVTLTLSSAEILEGVQNIKLPVYVENADNISKFYVGLHKDSETDDSWHMQINSLRNGWNIVEFACCEYLDGLATWTNLTDIRLVMQTNGGYARIYIADIILVKPQKAKIMVISDHAYSNFKNVAYPQLKALGIPVVWGLKISLMGQSIEYSSSILSKDEVDELASDPYSEINFHSWGITGTNNMSVQELREEVWSCINYLKKHGYYTEPSWRSAWWQNKAPNAPHTEDLLKLCATYDGNDDKITVFPFNKPHNIPRIGFHGMTYAFFDQMFDNLKKTHGIALAYTHDLSDDIPPEGTNNINVTTSEFNYFLSKIRQGVEEGWLEGVTMRGLYARYWKDK